MSPETFNNIECIEYIQNTPTFRLKNQEHFIVLQTMPVEWESHLGFPGP